MLKEISSAPHLEIREGSNITIILQTNIPPLLHWEVIRTSNMHKAFMVAGKETIIKRRTMWI